MAAGGPARDNSYWRTAIADYTHLYTNETFSPLKPDGLQQAAELKAAGGVVGANLMPENVALPDLRFTSAFMLSYGGSPMGVLAYVEPSGAPSPALHPRQRRAGMRPRNPRGAATCRSPGGRRNGRKPSGHRSHGPEGRAVVPGADHREASLRCCPSDRWSRSLERSDRHGDPHRDRISNKYKFGLL